LLTEIFCLQVSTIQGFPEADPGGHQSVWSRYGH
jgi:hypothetical protein